MAAGRVDLSVPMMVACFVLSTLGVVVSEAADRPNRSTQSDMAAGRMMDSIFELKQQNPRPRVANRRPSRGRSAAGRPSLQGKLVNNPDQSDGTPPYALVDRYGGVLRYVEPVSHIDLSLHIGKTVGVRRDTGDTLLASQLALSAGGGSRARSGGVQLVNFEETIAPGVVVDGPVVMHEGYAPGGQEPIYLDEGLNFSGCPDCGSRVGCGNYVGCGSACRVGHRRCLGGYFGYELTVLQPAISEATLQDSGDSFKNEFGFGHRFTLGYDGGNGLGVRTRYWFYNHEQKFQNAASGVVDLRMDTFDLEFTLDEQLRSWDMMVSGGIRYGRAGLENPTTKLIVIGPAEYRFEGVGPTVSFEAARCFGRSGIYLIGNLRASLLLGKFHNLEGDAGTTVDGETVTVLENQLGIGFSRELSRATLNFRTVWETQVWMNEVWGDDVYGFASNLTFSGPTTSVEVRF